MLEEYTSLVTKFQTEAESYALKPTKASSKRLRSIITDMKKLATPTKQHLIELDQEGY